MLPLATLTVTLSPRHTSRTNSVENYCCEELSEEIPKTLTLSLDNGECSQWLTCHVMLLL